ncbi:hypothetical protein [Nostoc sp. CHAB 5715]|uniref:hypothetical protein n=1 Tax=Nostoc sp. CHAB 5715 TaxID=2780400 RepID=UPI001E39D223|nr:hypothetical protein [Nostoc sp. CHAB 5715]MCC5623922.1 hypothetical protein [Nostoc sp. CHAB 5715]
MGHREEVSNAQCPMPNAQCPMPHTQYRPICTKINDLSHKESNHGIHPRVAPTAG